jgi:hypothetical protein
MAAALPALPPQRRSHTVHMYEICRLAESAQPQVHRNAVWLLAALSQNLTIVPALAPCCKKLLKVPPPPLPPPPQHVAA